mgnify:CR=1 FL=1
MNIISYYNSLDLNKDKLTINNFKLLDDSNYIVSTELDASEDLLENGKYGCLIAQENYKELALFCQKIINGEICIDVYENYDKEDISWDMIMRKQEKVMNKFL